MNQESLFYRVAQQVDIRTLIEQAVDTVNQTVPHMGSSDDGIDYGYGAALVLAELVGILRNSGGYPQDVADWLCSEDEVSPCDRWYATDGDLRWWLAETLETTSPELAAEWSAMIDEWLMS